MDPARCARHANVMTAFVDVLTRREQYLSDSDFQDVCCWCACRARPPVIFAGAFWDVDSGVSEAAQVEAAECQEGHV